MIWVLARKRIELASHHLQGESLFGVHASPTSNMLTVLGDAGDTLNADLSGGGFSSSTVLVGFTDYSNGVLTLRVADALTQSGVQL